MTSQKIWLNQSIWKVHPVYATVSYVASSLPCQRVAGFVSAGVQYQHDKEETPCEHRNSYYQCGLLGKCLIKSSWQHRPHMNSNRGLSAREVTLSLSLKSWADSLWASVVHSGYQPLIFLASDLAFSSLGVWTVVKVGSVSIGWSVFCMYMHPHWLVHWSRIVAAHPHPCDRQLACQKYSLMLIKVICNAWQLSRIYRMSPSSLWLLNKHLRSTPAKHGTVVIKKRL